MTRLINKLETGECCRSVNYNEVWVANLINWSVLGCLKLVEKTSEIIIIGNAIWLLRLLLIRHSVICGGGRWIIFHNCFAIVDTVCYFQDGRRWISNLKMVSWLETHFVECLLFLFSRFRLQNWCRFENLLYTQKKAGRRLQRFKLLFCFKYLQ